MKRILPIKFRRSFGCLLWSVPVLCSGCAALPDAVPGRVVAAASNDSNGDLHVTPAVAGPAQIAVLNAAARGPATSPAANPAANPAASRSMTSRSMASGSMTSGSMASGSIARGSIRDDSIGDSSIGDSSIGDPEAVQQVDCLYGPCANNASGYGSAYAAGNVGGYVMGPPPSALVYGIDPNEFLCNGWDDPPIASVNQDDSIRDLNPTDVVSHYTTESRDIELATSNEVCVYAPRFASVRKITGAVSGGRSIALAGAKRNVIVGGIEINEGGLTVVENTELGHAEVARSLDSMRERNRGVPVDSVVSLIQQTDVLAALAGISIESLDLIDEQQRALLRRHALAAVTLTVDQSVEVAISDVVAPAVTRVQAAEEFTVYELPAAGRLEVLKVVNRLDAQVGDTVEFAISIRNVGDSPVSDVRLADSLTTRLEYVAESQTCSETATFTASPNEAGSTRLVWELEQPLDVGELATMRFQCVVR